jgi:hypothetical protein
LIVGSPPNDASPLESSSPNASSLIETILLIEIGAVFPSPHFPVVTNGKFRTALTAASIGVKESLALLSFLLLLICFDEGGGGGRFDDSDFFLQKET